MFRLIPRVLLGSFLIFLGILGVSYLQKRFDDGDINKALAAVRGRVSGLENPADCRAEVVSRVKGEVRVVCGARSWLVNVLSARIAEEGGPP